MKIINLLVMLTIITILVVSVNIVTVFIKISDFKKEFSGYATQYGYINFTIFQVVSINLSIAALFICDILTKAEEPLIFNFSAICLADIFSQSKP